MTGYTTPAGGEDTPEPWLFGAGSTPQGCPAPGLVGKGNNCPGAVVAPDPVVDRIESTFASVAAMQDALNTARRLRRLRRTVIATADVVKLTRPGWACTMVTATTRDIDPGDASITELVRHLRRWSLKRLGYLLPYVWVAELQKRGAVHWHLLVWHPPFIKIPQPDRRGWWPHGHTNTVRATRPAGYVAKYASKGADVLESRGAKFPAGMRIMGFGGLEGLARGVVRWAARPAWLKRLTSPHTNLRRITGGFLDVDTGEVLASPWQRSIRHGAGTVTLVLTRRSGREAPETALDPQVLLWRSMPRGWQEREPWLMAHLQNRLLPPPSGPPQ